MARRYKAVIEYVVHEHGTEYEDDDDERLWASGGALAKALENYSGDSAGQISVRSAEVIRFPDEPDED